MAIDRLAQGISGTKHDAHAATGAFLGIDGDVAENAREHLVDGWLVRIADATHGIQNSDVALGFDGGHLARAVLYAELLPQRLLLFLQMQLRQLLVHHLLGSRLRHILGIMARGGEELTPGGTDRLAHILYLNRSRKLRRARDLRVRSHGLDERARRLNRVVDGGHRASIFAGAAVAVHQADLRNAAGHQFHEQLFLHACEAGHHCVLIGVAHVASRLAGAGDDRQAISRVGRLGHSAGQVVGHRIHGNQRRGRAHRHAGTAGHARPSVDVQLVLLNREGVGQAYIGAFAA